MIIVLVAAAVMVLSGVLPAFLDFLGGSIESLEPHLGTFRFSTYLWALAWVTLLLGHVASTRLLIRSGDEQLLAEKDQPSDYGTRNPTELDFCPPGVEKCFSVSLRRLLDACQR